MIYLHVYYLPFARQRYICEWGVTSLAVKAPWVSVLHSCGVPQGSGLVWGMPPQSLHHKSQHALLFQAAIHRPGLGGWGFCNNTCWFGKLPAKVASIADMRNICWPTVNSNEMREHTSNHYVQTGTGPPTGNLRWIIRSE